jgi:hypothetical protein
LDFMRFATKFVSVKSYTPRKQKNPTLFDCIVIRAYEF